MKTRNTFLTLAAALAIAALPMASASARDFHHEGGWGDHRDWGHHDWGHHDGDWDHHGWRGGDDDGFFFGLGALTGALFAPPPPPVVYRPAPVYYYRPHVVYSYPQPVYAYPY